LPYGREGELVVATLLKRVSQIGLQIETPQIERRDNGKYGVLTRTDYAIVGGSPGWTFIGRVE